MNDKPKSCPFCGGEATIYIKDWNNKADEFRVGCHKCGISQLEYCYDLEGVINAWNKRVNNEG